MERMKKFREKHFLIAAMLSFLGAILGLKLLLLICKVLFNYMLKGIIFLISNTVSGLYLNKVVRWSHVTSLKYVNAIIFYLELCLFVIAILLFTTLVMLVLIKLFELCLNKLSEIILGKQHQKSLKYNGFQIWFIKCRSDITFFFDWIRLDILKVRYSFGENNTVVNQVRMFSIENLISVIVNCFKFFFSVTVMHLILGIITIFMYYENEVRNIFVSLGEAINVYSDYLIPLARSIRATVMTRVPQLLFCL